MKHLAILAILLAGCTATFDQMVQRKRENLDTRIVETAKGKVMVIETLSSRPASTTSMLKPEDDEE